MEETVRAGYHRDDRMDRAKRIDWLDFEAIARAAALVVGAGALGNEVAKNLALSGFSKLTFVDFDRVERSNLSRCMFFTEDDARRGAYKAGRLAEAVRRLSPGTEVVSHVASVEDLPEDIYAQHDLVFGCLDNFGSRLHVNSHACASRRPYIDGGMRGTIGRLFVSVPGDGPCLECASNSTHAKIAELRYSCTGSPVRFFSTPEPAEITTTSIVSALAVREGLRLLSRGSPPLEGQMIFYDGLRGVLEMMEVEIDPSCPNHERDG